MKKTINIIILLITLITLNFGGINATELQAASDEYIVYDDNYVIDKNLGFIGIKFNGDLYISSGVKVELTNCVITGNIYNYGSLIIGPNVYANTLYTYAYDFSYSASTTLENSTAYNATGEYSSSDYSLISGYIPYSDQFKITSTTTAYDGVYYIEGYSLGIGSVRFENENNDEYIYIRNKGKFKYQLKLTNEPTNTIDVMYAAPDKYHYLNDIKINHYYTKEDGTIGNYSKISLKYTTLYENENLYDFLNVTDIDDGENNYKNISISLINSETNEQTTNLKNLEIGTYKYNITVIDQDDKIASKEGKIYVEAHSEIIDKTSDENYTYDGNPKSYQSIIVYDKKTQKNVVAKTNNYTILYKDTNGNYTLEEPYQKCIDLGSCVIEYQISKRGYTSIYSSYTINIFIGEKDLTFDFKESAKYTGKEIKLNGTIKYGDIVLIEGEDYEATYKNNIGVGTATVIIKGKGNYLFEKWIYIDIKREDIYYLKIKTINNQEYTGSKITPKVEIEGLTQGVDYTVSYTNNINPGTASVTIYGIGNYTGSTTRTFKILGGDINSLDITYDINENVYYNGYSYSSSDVIKNIKIKFNNQVELVKDNDYTINTSYKTIGEICTTIKGIDVYSGEKQICGEIKPQNINNATVNYIENEYTIHTESVYMSIYYNGYSVGTNNYDVEYKDFNKIGKGKIIIKGKNNFTGSKEIEVNIVGKELPNYFSANSYKTYNKNHEKNKEGILYIAPGYRDYENINYTIEYKDYDKVGTASIIVKGINDYVGEYVYTYTIAPSRIENTDIEYSREVLYTGKTIKPVVSIYQDGYKLELNKDYKISYSSNKYPGSGYIKIEGIGNYTSSTNEWFSINVGKPNNLKVKSQTTTSVTLNWDAAKGEFDKYIIYMSKSENGEYKEIARVSKSKTYYTKKGLTPGRTYYFKVESYDETKIKKGGYYISYSDAVSIKTATKPKAPTISLLSYENQINVKWSKISYATYYQVYLSTSKNGQYTKVGETTNLNYIIENLDSAKKYYIKVRAVKKLDGKNIYGSFNTVKESITKPNEPIVSETLGRTSSTIKITWDKVNNASGYVIYMATSKNGTYKKVATLSSKYNYYKKTGLNSNKTYYFKVKAYKKGSYTKYSNYSNVVSTKTLLKSPTLKLTSKSTRAILSWGKVTGAVGYEVYMYDNNIGNYVLVADIKSTKYTYKNPINKTKFKVKAYRYENEEKVYSYFSLVKQYKK